ncbi:MAG: hypothetical protein N2322_06710, partial [Terrimicrobiaceae bacterium]|nr:hypothetical protein [Terrimicrobiaceae bacterium]
MLLALLAGGTLRGLEVPRRDGEKPARINPFAPKKPKTSQPAVQREFANNPAGAGLTVLGLDEPLAKFSLLSFSFPSAMAAGADEKAGQSPVVFDPPLDAEFIWRSPSTGELRIVGPVVPSTEYRLRLREGLKDLAGSPLDVNAWGAVMRSPPLALEWSSAEPSQRLAAQRGQPAGQALREAITQVLRLPSLPQDVPDFRILRPLRDRRYPR